MKIITKNGQGIAYVSEKYAEDLQIALSILREQQMQEAASIFGMPIDTRVKVSFDNGEMAVAGAATSILILSVIMAHAEEESS